MNPVILIADRNPHVREFLKREIMVDGYQICLAKNCREVLKAVSHEKPIRLIIIDPDIPGADDFLILKMVKNRIPELPIIIHSHFTEYETYVKGLHRMVFVEKKGNSIEDLKTVIHQMLQPPIESIGFYHQ
ncbi:MAG: response regulator [Desulfobacterales bacterium]|nr:response regulator [Desulfobacterales bacterium]